MIGFCSERQQFVSIRDFSYPNFNVTNDNHSVNFTTSELVARFYEGFDVKKEMTQDETFYSNAKAKRLLSFDPQHDWWDYLKSLLPHLKEFALNCVCNATRIKPWIRRFSQLRNPQGEEHSRSVRHPQRRAPLQNCFLRRFRLDWTTPLHLPWLLGNASLLEHWIE